MMRILILLVVISLSSCGGESKEDPVVVDNTKEWENKLSTLVANNLSVDNNKVVLAE